MHFSPTYTTLRSPAPPASPVSTGTGTATGGGQPHNNMQPTSFWNVMVKL